MSTSTTKLDHLRQIVVGIESHKIPGGAIGGPWLDRLGLFRGFFEVHGNVVGIRKDAGLATFGLVDLIVRGSPRYARGVGYNDLFNRVCDFIIELFGDDPQKPIDQSDLQKLEDALESWFASNAATTCLYIPCKISSPYSQPFSIGPVSFTYVTDVIAAQKQADEKRFEFVFGNLIAEMKAEGAGWIANIDVAGCTKDRAWEIGDLATDIAVTGLQLVVPLRFSQRMARITARSLPRNREAVSCTNGVFTTGGTNLQPALAMGTGVLAACLRDGRAVLDAVGRRIDAFIAENPGPLPALEQAWCDAAYWYHEGLAEPLDTIAVPKLETAIEVLLRTESSSGSRSRVVRAIKTFYGLDKDAFINPDVQITVEKFAADFVRDRSRILHGTWSTLGHSLRDSRPSLTGLVHGLLTNYVVELDAFATDPAATDDVDRFLEWVATRRAQSSTDGT